MHALHAAVVPSEGDGLRLRLYPFGKHLMLGQVGVGTILKVSASAAWDNLKLQFMRAVTGMPMHSGATADNVQVLLLPDGEEVRGTEFLADNDKLLVHLTTQGGRIRGNLFDVNMVSEMLKKPVEQLAPPTPTMPALAHNMSFRGFPVPRTGPPLAAEKNTETLPPLPGSQLKPSPPSESEESTHPNVPLDNGERTVFKGKPTRGPGTTSLGLVPAAQLSAAEIKHRDQCRKRDVRRRFQNAVKHVVLFNRFRPAEPKKQGLKGLLRVLSRPNGNTHEDAQQAEIKDMDTYIKEQTNIYQYNEFRNAKHERLPWHIFHPEAVWRVTWDVLLLGLVVFFAVMVPYRIGFDLQLEGGEVVFDVCADVIFLIDICLNFRTAFKADGVLITVPSRITHRYLRAWFPIDLLASFPVGWFTGNSAGGVNRLFRMLRLFKLFRILRLLKLFPRLFQLLETSIKFNPSMIRFLRSFIIMIMIWHWIACCYWFISRSEYGGVAACTAPDGRQLECFVNHCLCGTTDALDVQILSNTDPTWYDSGRPDLWVPHPALAWASEGERYSQALFWSVQVTTGIGDDIPPRSTTEVVFTTCMTVVGLMMYSLIIGSASSALANMDSLATHRRQTLDSVTSFMRSRNVPSFFQRIIVDFYEHMWSTPSKASDVFHELPDSLQSRLTMVMNRDLVDRMAIFRLMPATVYIRMVQRLSFNTFLPGEFITRRHDPGKELFFIKRGKCDALGADGVRIIDTYLPGMFFGEHALLYNCLHPMSHRAVDFLDVYVMAKGDFNELQISAPLFCEEIERVDAIRQKKRLSTIVEEHRQQKGVKGPPEKVYRRQVLHVESASSDEGTVRMSKGSSGAYRHSRESRLHDSSDEDDAGSYASQRRPSLIGKLKRWMKRPTSGAAAVVPFIAATAARVAPSGRRSSKDEPRQDFAMPVCTSLPEGPDPGAAPGHKSTRNLLPPLRHVSSVPAMHATPQSTLRRRERDQPAPSPPQPKPPNARQLMESWDDLPPDPMSAVNLVSEFLSDGSGSSEDSLTDVGSDFGSDMVEM